MRNLKLLFITIDFYKNIERSSYYLYSELSKMVELRLWHQPGSIYSIIDKLDFTPDFILLNDMKDTHCPTITDLSSLEIPFGIIMHDAHYKVKRRKNYIRNNRVKHIFSIYRDFFYQRYPELIDRMYWLPHFANTEIFKDYGLVKDIDWLMMGRISKHYPLRKKMLEAIKGKQGFAYHKHLGYRDIQDDELDTAYVGEKYAREINRAKMFLTCNLIHGYTVLKYFEVLASRTLLLAPNSKELEDLGFIDGQHFVAITEDNFMEKAEYYLANEQERTEITNRGYQFVHQHHTLQKRAEQLVNKIAEIVRKP